MEEEDLIAKVELLEDRCITQSKRIQELELQVEQFKQDFAGYQQQQYEQDMMRGLTQDPFGSVSDSTYEVMKRQAAQQQATSSRYKGIKYGKKQGS